MHIEKPPKHKCILVRAKERVDFERASACAWKSGWEDGWEGAVVQVNAVAVVI